MQADAIEGKQAFQEGMCRKTKSSIEEGIEDDYLAGLGRGELVAGCWAPGDHLAVSEDPISNEGLDLLLVHRARSPPVRVFR